MIGCSAPGQPCAFQSAAQILGVVSPAGSRRSPGPVSPASTCAAGVPVRYCSISSRPNAYILRFAACASAKERVARSSSSLSAVTVCVRSRNAASDAARRLAEVVELERGGVTLCLAHGPSGGQLCVDCIELRAQRCELAAGVAEFAFRSASASRRRAADRLPKTYFPWRARRSCPRRHAVRPAIGARLHAGAHLGRGPVARGSTAPRSAGLRQAADDGWSWRFQKRVLTSSCSTSTLNGALLRFPVREVGSPGMARLRRPSSRFWVLVQRSPMVLSRSNA